MVPLVKGYSTEMSIEATSLGVQVHGGMACHSIDGRGNPGAAYPQLTSQHAQYIQATLKAMHDGTSWGDDAHAKIMPSIAQKLDEKDIAALASYVEGLHAADGAAAKPATP